MGLALASSSSTAAALLEVASAAAGADLTRALARGTWSRTELLQPALTAICLGAAAALRERGVIPAFVLGHSLGELAAWSCSGGASAADVVVVAATRGRLMAREAARVPGGLRALRRNESEARALLARHQLEQRVVIAAVNADDEVVVSGALVDLQQLGEGVVVAAAGAWHSPAMGGAVDELRAALAALPVHHVANVGFVSAATAALVDDATDVAALLSAQLVGPVRFAAALRLLRALGTTDVVIPGPARVLRGLCRRVLGELTVHAVETPADVDAAAERILS